jgi:hypothetical protein
MPKRAPLTVDSLARRLDDLAHRRDLEGPTPSALTSTMAIELANALFTLPEQALTDDLWSIVHHVCVALCRDERTWVQKYGGAPSYPDGDRLRKLIRELAGDDATPVDDLPVATHSKPSENAVGQQFVQLNDAETSICDAINRLWQNGLDWPQIDDIAREAGLEPQTAKNNIAPMARHGILEKGPGGRGFKVRT